MVGTQARANVTAPWTSSPVAEGAAFGCAVSGLASATCHRDRQHREPFAVAPPREPLLLGVLTVPPGASKYTRAHRQPLNLKTASTREETQMSTSNIETETMAAKEPTRTAGRKLPLVVVLLTMRMSKRLTLAMAMIVFVGGHVVVAAGAAEGARAMGVVGAGGALATVLGVPIGAMIAQFLGWRGTFWFLAAAASVAALFVAAEDSSQEVSTVRTQLQRYAPDGSGGLYWPAPPRLVAC